MSGLVLKLGPRERVLINGAVIENGERRSRMNVLTREANILRLRDAIHPDDVDSPVKRVCYVAQMVLAGDATPEEGTRQMLLGIEQLSQVFRDQDSRDLLSQATKWLRDGNVYKALRSLRCLMARETRLLAKPG